MDEDKGLEMNRESLIWNLKRKLGSVNTRFVKQYSTYLYLEFERLEKEIDIQRAYLEKEEEC